MQIVDNDRFRSRLRQVIEHLADRLEEPPRLEELAQIAGMSPYYFLRVYSRYMGETPMATCRRLRLNHAWALLAKRHRVGDVARRTGYRSSQAFSIAFRGRFGIPPSEVPAGHAVPTVPPHFERIAASAVASIPFHGVMRDSVNTFDELFKVVHRHGGRVEVNQVLAIIPDAPDLAPDRLVTIGVSVMMPRVLKGLDHTILPDVTCIVTRSNSIWPKADRDDVARIESAAAAVGYKRTGAPLMARPVLDPYRTAPAQRMWEILYPVQPVARGAA